VSDTQLDLKAGRITGNVKKLSAASKYEVKLPNGVAGIRGTLFDLSAEGVLRVVVGSMVMAWVDPKNGNVVTQVVMGGQQYDARSGQITPISESDLKTFDRTIAGMRVVQFTPSSPFAADRTLQNVSPIGAGNRQTGPAPVMPTTGSGNN